MQPTYMLLPPKLACCAQPWRGLAQACLACLLQQQHACLIACLVQQQHQLWRRFAPPQLVLLLNQAGNQAGMLLLDQAGKTGLGQTTPRLGTTGKPWRVLPSPMKGPRGPYIGKLSINRLGRPAP